METDKLHDLSFTELIGVKASQMNREDSLFITNAIDRILRGRVNNFRGYIDRYDQLTPDQKEIAQPCMRYRMQMGAKNYTPRLDIEPSLIEDGKRAKLASRVAQAAFRHEIADSIEEIEARNEEEECSQVWHNISTRLPYETDFIDNFGYRPDGSEA